MFLIDSHCHLDQLNYNSLHRNVTDVIEKAKKRDVRLILAVCTMLSNFDQMKALIGSRNDVLFACGIHPLNLDKNDCYLEQLRCIAARKDVVALGETGLDYSNIQQNTKKEQQKVFLEHISIGNDQKKPIIVHTRNAIDDTIALLREGKADQCSGILHCFTEDRKIAKNILDIGFYISFSGIVTFRNAEMLRDTVRFVPLNRLLIETDSPYLTPVPYRGKENQPAYVHEIAEYIATLKNINLEKLAAVTTANFCQLFNLKLNNLIVS
ncbi:YchF/TatD family DNA exonuclease [Candidatus Palibaumannia cicadellinicola]|uniref:Deoxyribonuclease n=1 Tax=Baumannia cicadellinicola subsp. Homalodisca coagulata TaxID=374463 RepID=Q1LT44_BAUCH|nr:YchF/TatD family DNA exonuclease [Candidatus Baumannia cicadellinicola]ABF13951.1 deoxyribonuclease [Baumannia cicadellinicola str. Hc (Homalodisca coagulata)]MBS0032804.1 YchF/TatD family DNA exonuclease [Candidatus Baumannia cicadellinicola]MBS0032851.1 YchF/TatD family DNA exonuclease [Candidatus Baumannia cicadellinicola]MCJ7462090.1 YchF/TatD family DNA exonuclease [Candidatus Baumannia cicadellinicola]MCJ7462615.1 YchF/TatD family DNA exonuclease [Candidatus Baumannia cicadellinicola]